jgi:hypothetical protein
MRVIITLESNPTIQNSRAPRQQLQRNAKTAYLFATRYPLGHYTPPFCLVDSLLLGVVDWRLLWLNNHLQTESNWCTARWTC